MGTLLKYEFRRSRTIFLGIIGVSLLVELVYLVGSSQRYRHSLQLV